MDALPRSGLPDMLASYADYRQLVDRLVETGCIEDATKIWWDIRPSARFSTLEQRVTDVCPRLQDVAAIAALYQSLLACLHGLRGAQPVVAPLPFDPHPGEPLACPALRRRRRPH